jgi:hypothetical protein
MSTITDSRPGAHKSPRRRPAPVFPESSLQVQPWIDPVIDHLGHDPRSAYAEQYWLSILGPSASWLVRRLVNRLESHPDGFTVNPTEWALELGLGAKGGEHGPFWRAVNRACRFGAAHRFSDGLLVRRRLPPLTAGQINRLPDHLRQAHDQWMEEQLARPRRQSITQWAKRRNEAGSGESAVGRESQEEHEAAAAPASSQ